MMGTQSILKAMAGRAVLHVRHDENGIGYSLSDSGLRAYVAVSPKDGKQVAASPLVKPREPGLLDGHAQSYVYGD